MEQGNKLAKILQWAYDMNIDMEFSTSNIGVNVKKRLVRVTFRKDMHYISHTFNNLNDSDEIKHFANQAAIRLLIKDLKL